jgi:hypothetical protein
MPSRFPRVDPYLEGSGLWRDFCHEFITAWRAALRSALPKHYEARIEEEIQLVELASGVARQIVPDVTVERRDAHAEQHPAEAWDASPEPVTLPLPVIEEEVRESWIEIRHRPDHSLVAVLELLSPTNKRGEHRSKYLAKRRTVLRHHVHLVELDFLLDGDPIVPPYEYPPGDCFALVARGDRPGLCEVRAWSVRDRLPELPIPLKAPDLDVVVDLQATFERAFDQGGYADSIDYDRPPGVSLSEADLHWAAERAHG